MTAHRARYDSVPCEHEELEPYPWGLLATVALVGGVLLGVAGWLFVCVVKAAVQLVTK
jgi:heme/copper-type cytochrome/quinol oxidase subunit 2